MDNIFIKVGGKSIELKLAGININAKNPADLFCTAGGIFLILLQNVFFIEHRVFDK